MKRIVLFFAFLTLTAAAGIAQDGGERVFRRLGLTDDQISQLAAIQKQTQAEMREGQTQVDDAKSQLAGLLLDPKADPKEVERLVHAASDGEAKIRLAKIRREMAVRQVIGERRWRRLMLFLRLRGGRSDTSGEQREQALQGLLDLTGDTSAPPP